MDDLVLLSKKENINHLKKQKQNLLETYEGKDLGDLNWFLNIEVIRSRSEKRVTLLQSSYIDKMTQKYHINPGRRISTPLSQPGGGPAPSQEQADPHFIHFYQSIIGSLLYIAVISRPDISFAVNILARQMSNPNDKHLAEAKRVLAYLDGTKNHGLTYGQRLDSAYTHAASDAAFADDKATMKSTEGYTFKVFGGAIDWRSKRQPTITKSTTKAELLSLSRTASELYRWKRLFRALRFDPWDEFSIRCNNLRTTEIVNLQAPAVKSALRHVNIHSCWLRQEVHDGNVVVRWIPTSEMVADGMTKSLSLQKHRAFTTMLGLQPRDGEMIAPGEECQENTSLVEP